MDFSADSSITSPFLEEEEMFRRSVRAFLDRELEPHYKRFEREGGVDRAFWRQAGASGLLGIAVPERLGGAGGSAIYNVVMAHEMGRSIAYSTVGTTLMADACTAILIASTNEHLLSRLASGILSGDVIQAMPMTEPHAGSDATAIKTIAVRDGAEYVINGAKTFSTNGNKADIFYVMVKTDASQGAGGMTMIAVEGDRSGLSRSKLTTMGTRASDLADLHFDNVRVPIDNLMGVEGGGLKLAMAGVDVGRLQIAALCLGAAEAAFALTLDYVRERRAFGERVIDFQNTRMKMADMKADIEAGRAMLHDAIRHFRVGALDARRSAMLKLLLSEVEGRVTDGCLQFFGGSGYIDDVPISRMYTAARVNRIYAGTSEMMKMTIAREFG